VIVPDRLGTGDDAYQKSHTIKNKSSHSLFQAKPLSRKQLYNILINMVVLSLPNEFGYVLIAAAVLAFECILIGFLFPGRVRQQVFTEEFMKAKFGRIHSEQTGN
jgi:hypothetical protein